MMKQKRLFLLMLMLFCLSFSSLFSAVCSAQETGVTITNVSAQLLQTRTIGTRVIRYYSIIVVLHNSDSTASTEISVKFHDPEYNATYPPYNLLPTNYSLMPGESKTFNFSQWPTPLTGDVPINVSFSPSSLSVPAKKSNSGYYVYSLHIGTSETKKSTPGFEAAFLVVAFIVVIAIRKIKT
jgi:hypothetical protein